MVVVEFASGLTLAVERQRWRLLRAGRRRHLAPLLVAELNFRARFLRPHGFGPDEPHPDRTLADEAARRLGGRIIRDDGVSRRPDVIY